MAILIEISTDKGIIWKDTLDVIWLNTTNHVWNDDLGNSVRRMSLDGEALDHYWDAYIESFASPQYQTATNYGGFVRIGFGEISLSLDAFVTEGIPPKQLTLLAKYTATTESAAVELFEGDIYLKGYDIDTASYTLNDPKYTQNLLDQGADYNGDTVPYPKAFGVVTHAAPLRVADNAGRPTYHLGGVETATTAKTITSFSSASSGTKTKVYTSAAHGWSTGTSVYISGTINFDGTHVIESATGSEFVIDETYPTTNSETLPLHANVFVLGGFAIFDDGVPIQSNVVVNGDGTFSLTASPVGTVTMSGTGEDTTLEDIMDWGRIRLSGILSLITTNARVVSPDISHWATSQMPVIDFMSNLCAFFTHYFYIKEDVMYLGDMLLDNGTDTADEFDYFDATYTAGEPTSQVSSSWTTYEAENGFVDEVRTARFIKTIENTVVKSIHALSTGTTDSTSSFRLIDSSATFITDLVELGHVAQNTTDGTSTTITSVNSETSLTMKDDIFITGEEYTVGPSYPYGKEISVTPYHDTKSNVLAALTNILAVLNYNTIEIKMPITATLPEPGERLTFTDTQLLTDVSTYIRVRMLTYNFNNEEIILSGEGVTS
jgi:hypothetical protein